LAQFYTKSDKVYDGVIRFGYSTDTYDAEGRPTSPETEPAITVEQIEPLLAAFRGTLSQTPPPISAKKIAGTPAYKLARKNKPVELAPVEVRVYTLEVVSLEGADLRVVVHCSAGTYLRAIAHEVGQAAGCGAFLKTLHRTRSGDFSIDQAHTLEELAELSAASEFEKAVIPAAQLLPGFPSEVLDQVTTGFVRQGRDFRVSPFRVRPGSAYVKALAPDGELLAIGEAKLPNLYHPVLVL
jgi:tRNA pseudouridine55 synthase